MTVIVGVIGVVILGTGIRGAAGIVAPTMLSLVLTIAVLPIGRLGAHHGWPSWLATLFALVTAYAILAVLLSRHHHLPGEARRRAPAVHHGRAGPHRPVPRLALSDLGLGTETTSDALKKVDPAKLADILADCSPESSGRSGGCSSW